MSADRCQGCARIMGAIGDMRAHRTIQPRRAIFTTNDQAPRAGSPDAERRAQKKPRLSGALEGCSISSAS